MPASVILLLMDYWFKILQQNLILPNCRICWGDKYDVNNFGHSGATLLRKGHNPYFKTKEFSEAIQFIPDIAIVHLGLNDTDPRNWNNYSNDFRSDYSWLYRYFAKSKSGCKSLYLFDDANL